MEHRTIYRRTAHHLRAGHIPGAKALGLIGKPMIGGEDKARFYGDGGLFIIGMNSLPLSAGFPAMMGI
jgi:hypothetical protein